MNVKPLLEPNVILPSAAVSVSESEVAVAAPSVILMAPPGNVSELFSRTLAVAGAVTEKCVAAPDPVTVSIVEPFTDPAAAVTIVVPGVRPGANPLLPALLLMGAMAIIDELHVTDAKVCCPPPLNVPVATSRWNAPWAIEELAGVTEIDVSPGGVIVLGVYNSALARASPLDTLLL